MPQRASHSDLTIFLHYTGNLADQFGVFCASWSIARVPKGATAPSRTSSPRGLDVKKLRVYPNMACHPPTGDRSDSKEASEPDGVKVLGMSNAFNVTTSQLGFGDTDMGGMEANLAGELSGGSYSGIIKKRSPVAVTTARNVKK